MYLLRMSESVRSVKLATVLLLLLDDPFGNFYHIPEILVRPELQVPPIYA
jgi:hypothetical protein